MIEAVPSAPYGSCADPVQLLSCRTKINNRRKILQKILKNHGDGTIKIASTATPLILGTPHSMTSQDQEMKKRIDQAYEDGLTAENNPRTLGQFIPEFTASPHPRFLGLAQSIRERRGGKVNITSPIYRDSETSYLETKDEPFSG